MSLDELIRRAVADGWTVEITGGGHRKLTAPNGALVFCSLTPSDRRSARNTMAEMRRAWPEWGRRRQKRVKMTENDSARHRSSRPRAISAGFSKMRWDGVACGPIVPHGATLADVWPGGGA